MGEVVQNFHALTRSMLSSQYLHVFNNPEANQTPYFQDLYGGFST